MRYLGQNFHNLVLYLDYRACLLPFVGGGVGHGCVCVFTLFLEGILYIFFIFFSIFYFFLFFVHNIYCCMLHKHTFL